MSKNTSVTLGDQYDAFIQRQIAKGRFGSASETVRAGLRLLEEQELKLEQLRAAIDEGDMSGSLEPFDIEAFLNAKKRR
ncbi:MULTISPECIES: type II toxin-antitoxin system ParD family antitoxin [unclassified Mesorhizobium]|uniref:type II toxin-antitoxin system ParD family antitoxin n=1 Tax=unclassified Mesorhizobium TaxID=325217 RepID=UPI000BAF6D62|nr:MULTISPECIES: type II toxin-antitoxin system ParD family antitoxin [unclassified Mesorhizobium]TGT57322.1 type II toxin-antitoxin system ParD family antitoxin [Mesorhizobium sp. M00.F.Ca.ET.170.01.1.1]AZO11946.1 type II toxin-antitoxin system ParD family antitoxin [Mesorhizobium sp. M3A.F.Ca.ET.080.04.2.1]PBB86160.1 type II toxin-antitoxin system ParD family antitoxin [Mesorhizobium sp. WSM3876]RWB73229.1 MAG: type II toxin-antitoxin system ParD family antitoxin [Mesorhizobium sp.]RWB83278.